ncbi:hypothetical protein [Streptomyces luteireticuli]|uniref:DNA-binding protein n=1 Tax=Streptomyces luteireticuli TaxID=173858 RepID=A0ABN0Z8P6_9ACTN
MITFFRYLLDERQLHDYRAFLPVFQQAARELARIEENPGLARLEPALKTFEGWYYQGRLPQRDARRVLASMFGYSIEQLWARVSDDGPVSRPTPLFAANHTDDHRADPGAKLYEMRRTADMAARRAADFAMGAEQGQIGHETMGLVTDRVTSLVEEYPRVPLSHIWDELAQTQDDIFRLIEGGRAKALQIRDLHILAAIVSFHLGKGCHDMGDAKLAMVQARVAGVCAAQADHTALTALVFGLKSLISYWSGRGGQALTYARQGIQACEDERGTVGVWLAGLEARAAALLGDEESARIALRRAQDQRERVIPDDLDAFGGLLTFPVKKELYYRVETEVLLGSAQIAAAERAVQEFSDPDDPEWSFGDQAGAQCNLALTRLHGGEIEGAAEALRPVLDLAPAQRNRGIVVSAARVGNATLRSPARDAVTARDIRAEIEAYTTQRTALPR